MRILKVSTVIAEQFCYCFCCLMFICVNMNATTYGSSAKQRYDAERPKGLPGTLLSQVP